MPVKVHRPSELKGLIAALASDLVGASIHLQLLTDLHAASNDHAEDFAQSNSFWHLTFIAHGDAAMLRLCRAYDGNDKSLNLSTLLDVIRDHPEWFDEAHFRERMKANPHVESLARGMAPVDLAALERERSELRDDLVKRLLSWRNNAVAHKSTEYALRPQEVIGRWPVPIADMWALLDRGLQILNHYSSRFDANVYSKQMIGHDDYRRVLDAVRFQRLQRRADIEAELQSLREQERVARADASD